MATITLNGINNGVDAVLTATSVNWMACLGNPGSMTACETGTGTITDGVLEMTVSSVGTYSGVIEIDSSTELKPFTAVSVSSGLTTPVINSITAQDTALVVNFTASAFTYAEFFNEDTSMNTFYGEFAGGTTVKNLINLTNGVEYTITMRTYLETDPGVFTPSAFSNAIAATPVGTNVVPVFITQPNDATILETTTGSFFAEASGTPTPAYQWQEDQGTATWQNMAGETSTTLLVPTTDISLNGWSYRCVATNSEGSTTSREALLTVNPPVSGQLFVDNFDGGLASEQHGIYWTTFTSGVAVTTDNPKSGTGSLKFTFNVAGNLREARFRYRPANAYTEIWIQYYIYYAANFVHQTNPSGGSSNNKFFDTKTVGQGVSLDYLSFNIETQPGSLERPYCRYRGRYDEGFPTGLNVPVNSYGTTNSQVSIPLETWTKVRFHGKVASRVGGVIQNDGVFQFWINDNAVYNYTNMGAQSMNCTSSSCSGLPAAVIPYALAQSNGPAPKLANSTPANAIFDFTYILGATNSGFPAETYAWVDELYVASDVDSLP